MEPRAGIVWPGTCTGPRSQTAWAPGIKKVHVVQSCHLDVGYAMLSVAEINAYIGPGGHFDTAISVARVCRDRVYIASTFESCCEPSRFFAVRPWYVKADRMPGHTCQILHCRHAGLCTRYQSGTTQTDTQWQVV